MQTGADWHGVTPGEARHGAGCTRNAAAEMFRGGGVGIMVGEGKICWGHWQTFDENSSMNLL